MKRLSLLISTLAFCQLGLSQTDSCGFTNCCVDHTPTHNNTNDGFNNRESESCATNLNDASEAFHNKYKRVSNYIPYPESHIALKTLRINIVIVGMNGQFPFIWENDDLNDDMTNIELLNFSFSHIIPFDNSWMTANGFPCPEPINPDYLPDSKIRIEVVNVRYVDSEYFAINDSFEKAKELIEFHLNSFPTDTNQLNWYLTKQYYGPGAGQVELIQGLNIVNEIKSLSVIRSGYGNLPYSGQHNMIHGHLPHEIAHTLDLDHTYGSPIDSDWGRSL